MFDFEHHVQDTTNVGVTTTASLDDYIVSFETHLSTAQQGMTVCGMVLLTSAKGAHDGSRWTLHKWLNDPDLGLHFRAADYVREVPNVA